MKVKVRYLVEKRNADGSHRYYWQPSSELREDGWTGRRLSDTIEKAIEDARRLNEALDIWYEGKGAPVENVAMKGSVKALVAAYKNDPAYKTKKPKTRTEYDKSLARIEAWAGQELVRYLDRKTVRAFYRSMLPDEEGGPGTAQANAVMRVLRLLLNFAIDEQWIKENPASKPSLTALPPREEIWTDHAFDTFIAVADAMGRASIATAVMIAGFLAQREGDVLRMTWTHFKSGKFLFRQSKRGKIIEVRVPAELQARLDTTPRAAQSTVIINDEDTGHPYTEHSFRRVFAAVRAQAIMGLPAQGIPAAPELETLWFADLRRTGMVWIAEDEVPIRNIAALSGHSIDYTQKIIETYIPATAALTDRAVAGIEARRARRKANQALEKAKGRKTQA